MLKAPLIISHETGGLDALADLQDLLNECQRKDGQTFELWAVV